MQPAPSPPRQLDCTSQMARRQRQPPAPPHTFFEAARKPPASFRYQPIHDFWRELRQLGPISVRGFCYHMNSIGWRRPRGGKLTLDVARTDLVGMAREGFARRLDPPE